MIEQQNADGSGWARFSGDMRMRYRLARSLTEPGRIWITERGHSTVSGVIFRVVFVMLNPSTADAFKPDNTVSRCCEFARRWGADVLDVVNLFAFRSTVPKALYDGARVPAGRCGDFSHLWRSQVGCDRSNDEQILAACYGASRVVAAWGNHGELADRGVDVAKMLRAEGIQLEALRLSDGGAPMHPLARGKNFIPYETEPQVFA